MASQPRFATYAEFWPHYISEHRDARGRWLHFVGTTGFVTVLCVCIAQAPLRMGVALALGALLVWGTWELEGQRSLAPVLLAVIGLVGLANPLVVAGVVWAYFFAWVGHFGLEKNRPATFTYPLWSLGSDFRMVAWMLTGRLWTGRGEEVAPILDR